MMLSRFTIPLAALAFLGAAACSQDASGPTPEAAEAPAPGAAPPAAEAPAGVPPSAEDTCGAAKYAGLVGRPVDMPGVPEPGPDFRHVGPDTQVTMDFRENRINMDISADGVITGFRCG